MFAVASGRCAGRACRQGLPAGAGRGSGWGSGLRCTPGAAATPPPTRPPAAQGRARELPRRLLPPPAGRSSPRWHAAHVPVPRPTSNNLAPGPCNPPPHPLTPPPPHPSIPPAPPQQHNSPPHTPTPTRNTLLQVHLRGGRLRRGAHQDCGDRERAAAGLGGRHHPHLLHRRRHPHLARQRHTAGLPPGQQHALALPLLCHLPGLALPGGGHRQQGGAVRGRGGRCVDGWGKGEGEGVRGSAREGGVCMCVCACVWWGIAGLGRRGTWSGAQVACQWARLGCTHCGASVRASKRKHVKEGEQGWARPGPSWRARVEGRATAIEPLTPFQVGWLTVRASRAHARRSSAGSWTACCSRMPPRGWTQSGWVTTRRRLAGAGLWEGGGRRGRGWGGARAAWRGCKERRPACAGAVPDKRLGRTGSAVQWSVVFKSRLVHRERCAAPRYHQAFWGCMSISPGLTRVLPHGQASAGFCHQGANWCWPTVGPFGGAWGLLTRHAAPVIISASAVVVQLQLEAQCGATLSSNRGGTHDNQCACRAISSQASAKGRVVCQHVVPFDGKFSQQARLWVGTLVSPGHGRRRLAQGTRAKLCLPARLLPGGVPGVGPRQPVPGHL